jgi:hypothetical protein
MPRITAWATRHLFEPARTMVEVGVPREEVGAVQGGAGDPVVVGVVLAPK